MYSAKVLLDSISPAGDRLTTFEVVWPHAIHKDMMTHRQLSRNFLSFRAYPPEKLFHMVEHNPFIPDVFLIREKGMNLGRPHLHQDECREVWLHARDTTLDAARHLSEMGVDKGQVNMLIQDFCWITGIVSATEWDNFFNLRANADDSQKPRPEVEKIARMMQDAREESAPVFVDYGEWHLPLIDPQEYASARYNDKWEVFKEISAGRCARASYLTHHGIRDLNADVRLCHDLIHDTHMSPLEHQARPVEPGFTLDTGNFTGWLQFRKEIPGENLYVPREA